jgi:hypothetical protein
MAARGHFPKESDQSCAWWGQKAKRANGVKHIQNNKQFYHKIMMLSS